MVDFSSAPYAPRQHQIEGVEKLVLDTEPNIGRLIPGVFGLLDEVGAGKSLQVVDGAQWLYLKARIDTVVVFTPGFARSTWADPDPLLGEVAKHCWPTVPNIVHEFHGSYTDLDFSATGLHWVVSNYEFIRRDERRDQLLDQLRGRRVWIVADESWCIANRSDQTRAAIMIRKKRADRATILNGTPLSDGKPLNLFYQFYFLDPDIIGCKNVTEFKAKFCITGGFQGKQIVGYQNLDELNRRIAPYILSRRTRDCFDLPPMLDPITVEARLTDPTWKTYREMRDDMVTWLGQQVSMSKQGITKVLRLSQICSGFLGGLEDLSFDDLESPRDEPVLLTDAPMPQWLRKAQGVDQAPLPVGPFGPTVQAPVINGQRAATVTKEISREKVEAFLLWLDLLPKLPHKIIVWCRFKPELVRLTAELKKVYPTVVNLWGKQQPDERAFVKALLAPGGDPRSCAVVGIVGTGAASLNFSAASVMVFMSHDPALIKRTQSIGRIERPGQESPMLLVDVVATGPKGQKTYDHQAIKQLRSKHDMATFTVNEWRRILAEE